MDNPQFEDPNNPYATGFAPEPPPKTRGCFFYGCIIAVVLAVLAFLSFVALMFVLYYYANRMVHEYTATAPVKLPQVSMDDDQRKAIDDRWKAFTANVEKGEAAEIVLTADDINALLSENPQIKGKAYITLKGDQVSSQLSWPLDDFGFPLWKGRYLNGNASLTVTMNNGLLDIRIKSIEVNGKTPPPDVLVKLGRENIIKNVKFDQDAYAKMQQVEKLEIKDGKVFIKTRSRSDRRKPDADATKGDDTEKDDDQDKVKNPDRRKVDPSVKEKGEPAGTEIPKKTSEDEPVDIPKEKGEEGKDAPLKRAA